MARPIKETPILKGKDAKVFIEKYASKRKTLSEEEKKRIKENHAKINELFAKA